MARAGTATITSEGVFCILLAAGLAWVPLWLGSNRLISWGINAILFPSLAAFYEISLIVSGMPHPVPIKLIRLPVILLAAAALWAFAQNAAWMPCGWQHPLWQLASEVLGRYVPGSISVDRDLTALALVRLITAASVFWLALQLGRHGKQARFLLWSVAAIGGVYAVIGLLALNGLVPQAFLPGETGEIGAVQFVASTFSNQDHYATFAGIGLILVIALSLRIYSRELRQAGGSLRLKIVALIATTGTKGAFPLALAFVILVALLLTGSRGGILAAMAGVLALFLVNGLRLRHPGRGEAVLGVFAALLLGAAFFGFGDLFTGRLREGLQGDARFPVYAITIHSILSAPFLGYGYGTFESVFPMFRDGSVSVWPFWEKAHNTYLEIFQGLGVIFGTMLIASVLLLVLRCLKGSMARRGDATVPAAAASVSFLVGAHALVDFSLQVQAVTLTYMAVLGLGVAQGTDVTGGTGNLHENGLERPWLKDSAPIGGHS